MAQPEKGKSKENQYYVVASDAVLSDEALAVIDKIGPLYFAKTGKRFYVNSGTRDAKKQATAMLVVIESGDKTLHLYTNKKAKDEVLDAYKSAKSAGKVRDEIIKAMTEAIQKQVDRGILLSPHMRAGGIDIAIIAKPLVGIAALTSAEKKIMIMIAKEVTGGDAFEEKSPPHIHIQYK